MKIISLIGSPNGLKGNTAALLRIVLKGAEESGAQTETIALKGGSIHPCMGCDTCHVKGICPQKDDFNAIRQKIMEADGLVLASPNYIFSVSAQLKAFMDRCCGPVHLLEFEGKYGASVVTSGGGDEEAIADYMNHFLMITGVIPTGSVWATMGMITGHDFPKEIQTAALNLGKKLVTSWRNREIPAGLSEKRKAFFERMRMLMLYRKEQWPYEYAYWMKHRGL